MMKESNMKLFYAFISLLFTVTFMFAQVSADIRNLSVSQKNVETNSGSDMMHLSWNNMGEGIMYLFQMASDRDFRHILIQEKCRKSEITFPKPQEPGTYFVRTKPLWKDGYEGVFSAAQNFEIGSELSPPVIITPVERSEFRGIYHIEVTWRTVVRAARYHLVLAKDRSFRHIIFEDTQVNGNALLMKDLDYGTYFLKMSSVAKDGKEGPFSDTVAFIITPQ
jgi:hypothetical protein